MSSKIRSNIDINSNVFKNNKEKFSKLLNEYKAEQEKIKLGGGSVNIQKQHDKGRMTARERIKYLVKGSFFGFHTYKQILWHNTSFFAKSSIIFCNHMYNTQGEVFSFKTGII